MINTVHIDSDYVYGFRSFCSTAADANTNKRNISSGIALYSNNPEELAKLIRAASKRYNNYNPPKEEVPAAAAAATEEEKLEDEMRKASFVLTTELRAHAPAAKKTPPAPAAAPAAVAARVERTSSVKRSVIAENLKTIVGCGVDASDVLSVDHYPTRTSAADWEYEELIVWICRTVRVPRTELACELPLVAILYVHRFGANANLEFLCEFQDKTAAAETRKFWVPYVALTHTKEYYAKLVAEYKFDINYEINYHFEAVHGGNDVNLTESQIQAKIDAYMNDVIPDICKYRSFTRSEYLVKQIKHTRCKVFSSQALLPNGKFATPKRAAAGLGIDGTRINQASVYDKTAAASDAMMNVAMVKTAAAAACFIAKGISMVNDDVIQGDFKVVVVSDAGALSLDPRVIPKGGAYGAARQAFARAVARFKDPKSIRAKGIKIEPLKDLPLYSKPNTVPVLSQLVRLSADGSGVFKDACALVREELAQASFGAYVGAFGDMVANKQLNSTPLQRILGALENGNVLAAHYSLSMLSESKYAAQESAEAAFVGAFMGPPLSLSTDPVGSVVNLTHAAAAGAKKFVKKMCCIKNLNLYSPSALAQQYYYATEGGSGSGSGSGGSAFACKECGSDSFLPNVSFLDLDVPCQTVVNIQAQIAEADVVLVLGTSDLQAADSEISSVFCTLEENAICIESLADMEALASALEALPSATAGALPSALDRSGGM